MSATCSSRMIGFSGINMGYHNANHDDDYLRPLTPEEIAAHDADWKLKQHLEKQGYYNVRILPDGIVCNVDMLFTSGVAIDPDYHGINGGRVCYPNKSLAMRACDIMKSIHDDPLPGFTSDKRRGGYGKNDKAS